MGAEYSADRLGIEGAGRYPRGQTRVGHDGFVAWIDDETRAVHCQRGRCESMSLRGQPVIRTDDREHLLEVPHGRLQWSQAAALASLAADVRDEGEAEMRKLESQQAALQGQLAAIARGMLLHLVAIEMFKAGSGDPAVLKTLGASLNRIEQD